MDDLYLTDTTSIPGDELRLTFVRSRGPGGQNVNKVNTKAVLRWAIESNETLPSAWRERFLRESGYRVTKTGDIVLSSDRYRDQPRNRDAVLERLRSLLLSVKDPPKKRRPTKPSRAARQRRLDNKKQRSETKRGRRPPKWDG
jgi:ribosome-associated protein